MEDVLYLGPESPADLWWSQGAKNPRIEKKETSTENGLPNGDTNSVQKTIVNGTLKDDTNVKPKVNFSEMKNFVHKKLDFVTRDKTLSAKKSVVSDNGTLESETNVKPEPTANPSSLEESKPANGPLNGETDLQGYKPQTADERNKFATNIYRQPKDETVLEESKKNERPKSFKKPSGCERRKRKGYCPQRFASPRVNEIREGVEHLNLSNPKKPRKTEVEDRSFKFRNERKRNFDRAESVKKNWQFRRKNLDRDFPELPKKGEQFQVVTEENTASCSKWTKEEASGSKWTNGESSWNGYNKTRNPSPSKFVPKPWKRGRDYTPPAKTQNWPRKRSENHSKNNFEPSKKKAYSESENHSRNRFEPSQKKAYSDIVKNNFIDAVIINEDHPEGILTPDQKDLVIDNLITALVEYPCSSTDNIPRFHGYGLVKGILTVTCVDESSLEWLKDNPLLDIFENSRLKVIRASDFARLARVTAFIPGPVRENADILKLLKMQNKELNTHRWRIYHRGEVDSGVSLVLGVDNASIEMLHTLDLQPYYGMGRADFYISSKRDKSKNS